MIPPNLVKARLEEISWGEHNLVIEGTHKVKVRFNPDSLKLSFSNQTSGGDQRGGSAIQFVGSGMTKLSFDLWFDVTSPEHNTRRIKGAIPNDVRKLTEEVAFFMIPNKKKKDTPPGLRFVWGQFLFEGIMESLSEEISYFSEDGRPLRSKVSLSLTRQDIKFQFPEKPGSRTRASTASSGSPRKQVKKGDTAPGVAGDTGNAENWPAMAAANGIENPRVLQAGIVLDMSAAAGITAGASVGFGASASAGGGIGFGAGASAGGGIGFGAGASAGGGIGFGAGASASGALGGGLRAGAAASAGGGIGGGASAGIGGGASAGFAGGASAGFGGGASAGFGAGASAGFGAGLSGGFGASAGVSGGFGAGIGGGGSVGLGGVSGGLQTSSAAVRFDGAAASASARASASFDLRLRR